MHFFSPEIHSLNAPAGKAVSECPLLSYAVAFLWKVFGEHEYIYRLLEYFIYVLAVFILFNTLSRFFKLHVLSFFVVSILLTSPLLVFYSFNFLSDVPALSFNIMCFCFLFSFYKTKAAPYFYLALFVGMVAVLLKPSALLGLSLLIFIALVDLVRLNKLLGIDKLFKRKFIPFLLITVSLILIKSWYDFALQYNTFNNGIFLLTILPIWEMTEGLVLENLKLLANNLFPVFLNRPMFALFFCCVFYVVFNFKKLDVFLKISFIFSSVFFIFYILFFFQVLTVHDYYLVNLFIFPVISAFCFASIISQNGFLQTKFAVFIMSVIFIFNAFYSAVFYRLRMIEKDNIAAWYPFVSKDDIDAADYRQWDYQRTFKPLDSIRPVLRKLGIKRTDLFVCIPDGSPNISLYFMDQKGYTISPYRATTDSTCIKSYFDENIKYVLLLDQDLKKEKCFQTVSGKLESIFRKANAEIFKLKK